jgi:hypothetical protein
LASAIGGLSLSLRNYAADSHAVAARRLSAGDLVPTVAKETPAAPATAATPAADPVPAHTIEILRGTEGTSYDVKDGAAVPAGPISPKQPKKAAGPKAQIAVRTAAE